MKHTYKTSRTCARNIEFELDGDTVRNVRFEDGCSGNVRGVASLVEGIDKK